MSEIRRKFAFNLLNISNMPKEVLNLRLTVF